MEDFLQGVYAPVKKEGTWDTSLKIEGELPLDLKGMFVRNGPNPFYDPEGPYHWFDGDGMIHSLRFDEGRVSYQNKFIATQGLAFEKESGKRYPGILGQISPGLPGGPFKNTSNTDIVAYGNDFLSLWWLGGDPYLIDGQTLATKGPLDFKGTLVRGMGAHPKCDPMTGDIMFIDFSVMKNPYLSYNVLKEGKVVHHLDIERPAPHIQHDMAITENYSILLDVPMGWDAQELARGKAKIRFFSEGKTEFGILPRYGDVQDIKWFSDKPVYIFHTINAWEENNKIILWCFVVDNPMPVNKDSYPRLSYICLAPELHRYCFDLETGKVESQRVDSQWCEFPRINDRFLGRQSRYAYAPAIINRPQLSFGGLVCYDLLEQSKKSYFLPEGHLCGEWVYMPGKNDDRENSGYVGSFVINESTQQSSFQLFRASDILNGPVAIIHMPDDLRVPLGFHADYQNYWKTV